MKSLIAAVLLAPLATAPLAAQTKPAPNASPLPGAAPASGAPTTQLAPAYPQSPPKLIVAISVDQFSADLFG